MAAKGKPFCKAQRSVQGFAAILKFAACEWFLIFLMLIDALLSYVLTKFAHICKLETPCILCSRLDHLLGKEKHDNYRNLLCTNHKLEISSLVSCYKHNKLVDGSEVCDACLCSFATSNNRPKSNSKMKRLMVGKLRSDTGGNGAHGKLLNRNSIPHCVKTGPCSCCSKPRKMRPNAQRLLQLKSSVNVATKSNIPYPRRLNSRDSLKKMRDNFFDSVTLQHPRKTGFNLLSHVGYSELRISSDSELEVLLSEEDDKSLICEKSDSVLRSITQIPLKPHCNNCDQDKPSINFVDSRPSPLESYVQVDVQKLHDVKSLACDATFHGLNDLNWLPWPANPSANLSTWAELISLDEAPSPASNALGLLCANSMEKSELIDSPNQESNVSCPPEFITSHDDPQAVGKFTTSEETGTNNMGIASPNELEDQSTLISTKIEESPKIDEVVNESSSGNNNDDANHSSDSESSKSNKEHETTKKLHSSDSESSESDKEHEATRKQLVSSSGNTHDDSDHSSHSESSESDKEHEANFATQPPLEPYSGNINDGSNDTSDGDLTKSDKEHEVNISTKQLLEKEIDIVTNGLEQPPSINTTIEEGTKTDEVVSVCESTIKNTNDDIDHSSVSESSKSDKEQEVLNFTSCQPLEKEIDLGTNDLKESPLINTTIEECLKIDDEVVCVSVNRNTIDDMDHNSANELSESDKEQEVVNVLIGQSLEKEIDIATNDMKESPLINTRVEEYPNVDEVAYESTVKNINGNMDNVSESTESDKEPENFIGESSEKETNLVTNDLKQSLLISTTTQECPKADEVTCEFAVKNINDDIDNVSESIESDKEPEIFIGESSDKETNLVTNDLKPSLLISTRVEECPKTDEVTCEFAVKNINDDMDNVSESIESDKEPEIFIGESSEKETNLVTNDLKQSPLISTTVEECPKTDELVCESDVKNINDDMDNISESTKSDKEHDILNISRQSSEKETDLVTNDLEQSLSINTRIEQCPTTHEVVYESTNMITNDDMDHSSVSESSVGDKQQEVLNFPSKMEPDIVTNDMEQLSLQNNPAEFANQLSSDDEGLNFGISYDDVQEEFAARAFHRSVSMESVESLDGSNVSEIEGENIVDRLKRQVEYDKKCIISLYKELDEERSASEVAASQAMAMITRLQEEKAAMHMEALHYLRMMEEQAEYDVEALEKANELLNEKERDIQDLEAELEYYRSNFMVDTIAETEHEKSDGANEESITAENDNVEHYEYNGNYSFKSIIAESSKASYRSLNNQTSSFEFEDEKIYIQLCLKSLEEKINKIVTNGIVGRVPNTIDSEEEMYPEQKGEESIDAQRNNEENGPSRQIDQNNCNGTVTPEGELVDPDKNCHFGSEENFSDVKGQISYPNKREEVDFLALEHKISDLTGRLQALQADYDFLEHSLNSLHYGEEGLQFAQNIVHQLQELCKLGIRLDRQPGS